MLVQIDSQGVVEAFFGPVWEPGPDRAAGRWREAQLVLDAIAREVELLAIELCVGPRVERFDEVHVASVHHFVVNDLPPGVLAKPYSAGPHVAHARATIDGAALDALSDTPMLEWATLRVLATFVATADPAWSLAGASDVLPFDRRGTRGVAGPLDRPGFGLHGPLDVTIDDDLGRTRVRLGRAWSNWQSAGPELDRYRRIAASLASLGLRLEEPDDRGTRASVAPVAPVAPVAISAPSAPAPAPASKPEHCFIASRVAGPCAQCRHGIADDTAGAALTCRISGQPRALGAACEARVALPRYAGQPQSQWATYFFFEQRDGSNAVAPAPYNADVFAEDFEWRE